MATCDRITRCALFQHFSLKASLHFWTSNYCERNFGDCERLKLATANQPVPANLLPNGKLLPVSLDKAELADTGLY